MGDLVLSRSLEIGYEPRILLEHQRGEDRAGYGEAVMRSLSERLTEHYREGYSRRNLAYMRSFYLAYSDRRPEILQPIAKSEIEQVAGSELATPASSSGFLSELPWGHYRALSKVASVQERRFYEVEAVNAQLREGTS